MYVFIKAPTFFREIYEFIETMEEIGDKWTEEQVEETYGSSTLEDALRDRKSVVNTYLNILSITL